MPQRRTITDDGMASRQRVSALVLALAEALTTVQQAQPALTWTEVLEALHVEQGVALVYLLRAERGEHR